jgi:hypothetical protein
MTVMPVSTISRLIGSARKLGFVLPFCVVFTLVVVMADVCFILQMVQRRADRVAGKDTSLV